MNCNDSKDNSIISNKGFSIVELVVCLAILAFATIAIAKAFTMGAWNNSKSQKLQEATSIAESTMEEIKRLSINALETKYGSSVDPSLYGEDIDTLVAGVSSLNEGMTQVVSKNSVDTDKYPFYVLLKKAVKIADNGISVNVTGEREYNVVASISADPYKSVSANDGSNANGYRLPDIDEIDQSEQMVLGSELNQYDMSALNNIKNQYADSTVVNPESVTKAIKITLEDGTLLDRLSANSTTGLISAECEVVYSDSNKEVRYNIFSGTYSDSKGGNVYIFYSRPTRSVDMYKGKDIINVVDNTTVKKNANHEIVNHNIFFILQNADTNPVKLNNEFEINITNKGSGEKSVPTDCQSTFTVESVGGADIRKNKLYTNLADNGGNVVLSGNAVGELFERKANKNNIYQIEVVVLDADDNSVCAKIVSTKSGDWE